MNLSNYAAMCLGYFVVGVAVICMATYLLDVALAQCRDMCGMTKAWWQFLSWRNRERKKSQPPKEKKNEV